MGLWSTERLVVDLVGAHAPDSLVVAARDDAFHDFKSDSATPIIDLVHECERHGLHSIAKRARSGDYDATKQEADEWAASPDGQRAFRELTSD